MSFQMFRLDLERAEEPEIKMPTSVWSSKSKRIPEKKKKKTSNSALLTVPKTLCGSQLTVENSSRWEYQTNWPASWEIYMQVSNQQVELHMEYTDSKEGKDYIKAVYCHPII